jgi:hypothetical protein
MLLVSECVVTASGANQSNLKHCAGTSVNLTQTRVDKIRDLRD